MTLEAENPPVKERSTLTPEFEQLYVPRGWIGSYVRWACHAVPSPPIYHVACALAYAAFELARQGWSLEQSSAPRPALWWSLIGGSGIGKGAAINCMRDVADEYDFQAPPFLQDNRLIERGVRTSPVFNFRGTPEGLFMAFEKRLYEIDGEKRSVMLAIHDEFNEVLARARRHEHFMSDMIDAWDQKPDIHRRQVNTARGDAEGRRGLILNPTLSTVFASTEARLQDVLTKEYVYGGFGSRLIWVRPPDGWVNPAKTNPEWRLRLDRTEKRQLLAPIVEHELLPWVGKLQEAEQKRIVCFGRHLLARHHAWMQQQEKIIESQGPNFTEATARLSDHLLMLASIVAVVEAEEPNLVIVQEAHHEVAENIMLLSLEATQAMVDILQPEVVKEESAGIEAIKASRLVGMTTRELVRAFKRPTDRLRPLLDSLYEEGVIVRYLVTKRGGTELRTWVAEYRDQLEAQVKNTKRPARTLGVIPHEAYRRLISGLHIVPK